MAHQRLSVLFRIGSFLLWCALAGLFCLPASVLGQAEKKPTKPPDHNTQIQELMESVGELQIEYRADIQLSAIENGKLLSSKSTDAILSSLFADADQAKYPYRLTVTDSREDTRDTAIAITLAAFHLDALSIKTRVVHARFARDPEKASQTFQSIHLEVPPTGCQTTLVPDVSAYFDLFTQIGNWNLDSGPKRRDDFVVWTAAEISGFTSPHQLAPMATSLSNLHLDANQLKILADTYVNRLQELQASDRDLASIAVNKSLDTSLRHLADRLRADSWPVLPLIQAYRTFLVRSAKQPACSDYTTNWGELAKSFNDFSSTYGGSDREKLDLSHLVRSRDNGGSAQVQRPPDNESLYAKMHKLDEMRSNQQRGVDAGASDSTIGWESDVASVLDDIDAMDPSRYPCPACAFSAKSSVLLLYFDATPNGVWKQRILDHLVRHLADQPMEEEAPLEWLFTVNILLNMSRKISIKQRQQITELEKRGTAPNALPSDLGPEILQAMKQSGDRALSTYASADEILQNQYVMPPHPE